MKIPLYRILGLILVAAAPIAYLLQQAITANVILFVLAGLILLFAKEKAGLSAWHIFKSSFKHRSRFGWIFIYDVVFWLVLVVISLLFGQFIQGRVTALGLVQLEGQALLNPSIVRENIHLIQTFFAQAAVGLVITLLLLWISYSYLNGASWTRAFDRVYSKKHTKAFFGTSAFLLIAGTVLSALILVATKPEALRIVLPVVILLGIHFGTFINLFTTEHASAGKGIQEGIIYAFSLSKFIVPYAYIGLLYLVLMIAVTLTSPYPTLTLIASGTALVLGAAWLKLYMRELITTL